MYELKMTFTSADALYAAVAKLAGEPAPLIARDVAQPEQSPVEVPAKYTTEAPAETKKPRRGKPAQIAMVEDAAPEHVAEPTLVDAEVEAKKDEAEQAAFVPEVVGNVMPTGDDVKAAAEAVNAKVGIAKLKGLLAEFQAARISEVRPEDRAGFVARAKELCA